MLPSGPQRWTTVQNDLYSLLCGCVEWVWIAFKIMYYTVIRAYEEVFPKESRLYLLNLSKRPSYSSSVLKWASIVICMQMYSVATMCIIFILNYVTMEIYYIQEYSCFDCRIVYCSAWARIFHQHV